MPVFDVLSGKALYREKISEHTMFLPTTQVPSMSVFETPHRLHSTDRDLPILLRIEEGKMKFCPLGRRSLREQCSSMCLCGSLFLVSRRNEAAGSIQHSPRL